MAIAVKERAKVKPIVKPKFRDPATMTKEELTDPDYRLKQLAKEAGLSEDKVLVLACSKCHHCR